MKKILYFFLLLILNSYVFAQRDALNPDTEYGLQIGSVVENFSALSSDGNIINLSEKLEKGPVVLVFYRGFWCPYCNKHLEILQDSLQLIYKHGVSVLAISPEKPEYLQKMQKRSGAEFTLLYDESYQISDRFQLTFKPSKFQVFSYNTFLRANMKDSHSGEDQLLPIPATFIIDQQGKVIWRQVDPDYKKRSNVKDILDALEKKGLG